MRSDNVNVNFSDMWCHSSVSFDDIIPKTNLDCLAEDWRVGGITKQGARENLLAHIVDNTPRSRHRLFWREGS